MYIGRYPVISAVFFLARGLIDPRRIPFELTEIVAELFQIITSLICVVLEVGIRNQLYSFNVFLMLSGVVHWCPQNSMASVVLAQWCITEFSPWTLPLILGINPSFYGKTSKTYISLNILLPSMLPWRMLVVNANYYPGKTFMVYIPFVLPRKMIVIIYLSSI